MTKLDLSETVKAKDREEAEEKCKYEIGQLVRISSLDIVPAGEGRWMASPNFKRVDSTSLLDVSQLGVDALLDLKEHLIAHQDFDGAAKLATLIREKQDDE